MAKDYNRPPYHWRAGNGYMPPVMLTTFSRPQPALCFAPAPFPSGPAHGFYPCAPPPQHGRISHLCGSPPAQYSITTGPTPSKAKPQSRVCAVAKKVFGKGSKCCAKMEKAETVYTATDSESSDCESDASSLGSSVASEESSCESVAATVRETIIEVKTCKSVSRDASKGKGKDKMNRKNARPASNGTTGSDTNGPPDARFPHGLRKGVRLLYTGTPCSLHIIDGSQIPLSRLTCSDKKPPRFPFRIYTAQDNSTAAELIAALGGKEGGSVTQVWEWGDGRWKKGSLIEGVGDKAGRRLSELGWSGAGSRNRAPVWLCLAKE